MKTFLKIKIITLIFFVTSQIFAQKILIPMDLSQTDHLKSYGVAFFILKNGGTVDWLLNYRGGSFMFDFNDKYANECRIRGVSFENISEPDAASIYKEVQAEDKNMDVVKLEK